MTTLVLDTGPLIALDRNDRTVWAMLRNAADDSAQVSVPAGVVAQAWRGGSRQALLARALTHCDEVPLEGSLARATGLLCGRAGTADIVDASVALVAAARSHAGPTALITSDPTDLGHLLQRSTRRSVSSPSDPLQAAGLCKPAERMAGFVVGHTIRRLFELVVLDAMGVLFVDADDVGRLLIPFLDEKGLNSAREVVEPLYIRCSSGEFSTAEFWRRLGASGDGDAWDDEYVRRYTLNAGVQDFLQRMFESNTPVAALTNDASARSLGLRRRFQIEHQIGPWIVSGDNGHRKPAAAIYHCLLAALPDVAPENMLFVDDRPTNLDAAAQAGMSTVRFGSVPGGNHPVVEDFGELQRFIFDR